METVIANDRNFLTKGYILHSDEMAGVMNEW
jgi:hypothetical protein